MKKILTVCFLVFVFISINFSQVRKIDEIDSGFSHANVMKMYEFGNEFINSKSIAQILVYPGKKDTLGFPYRMGAALTSFLTLKFPIEKSQIILTRCRVEQDRRTELWLISKTEDSRKCENNILNLTQTILFDSIYYDPEWDSCCLTDDFDEEQYKASLEAFASILKNNPSIKAHLFFYLGTNIYRNTDNIPVRTLDSPKIIKELVKKAKRILIENGIESSRFVLINGGYKDSARNIELWLVPKGEKPPKPKPNFFPKK